MLINAKPAFPPTWASNVNYSGGPAVGVPNTVAPSLALIAEGFRPGQPFSPQIMNYLLQQYGRALNWTASLPLDGWRKVASGGEGTDVCEAPHNVLLQKVSVGVVTTLTETSGQPGSGCYIGSFSFGASATICSIQTNGKRACALTTDGVSAANLWSTEDFLATAAFAADTQPSIPSNYLPTTGRLIPWIAPDGGADGFVFVLHTDIYTGVPSSGTLTWTLSQANAFGTHSYLENAAQSAADSDGTYFLAAIPPVSGAIKIWGGALGSVIAQQDLPSSSTGDWCGIVAKGNGVFVAIDQHFRVYSIDLTAGTPTWTQLGSPAVAPTFVGSDVTLQNDSRYGSIVALGDSLVCIAASNHSGDKVSWLVWTDDYTNWFGFRADCELLHLSGDRLFMQDFATHDTYASPRLSAAFKLF